MVASLRNVSARSVIIGQAPPPPAPPTIIELQAGGSVQYQTQYNSALSLTTTSFSTSWDTVNIISGVSFDTIEATFLGDASDQSIKVLNTFQATPTNGVIEFKVIELTSGRKLIAGYINAPGGLFVFDPNNSAGGTLNAWNDNIGNYHEYADGEYAGATTWGEGDVIGMVYQAGFNKVSIFINGVFSRDLGVANPEGYLFVGFATI